ncbi:MOSC domain-containing protein [Streptosporangiaceae bacterium NEAU-GS5]|nr:MOSC domain-containing protein [Streptosporangiaceae bacterium NEAU-GS5]
MRLADIRIYPLKSGLGVRVERAVVERWGLVGDRRWAVVDERGDNLWSGEHSRLLRVTAALSGDILILCADGLPELTVSPPLDGQRVPVGYTGLNEAVLASDEAHAWLTKLLGTTARLVWLDDPARRSTDPAHGGLPGEIVSFAWDAPLLLASASSMRQLNDWIAQDAVERGEDLPEPLDIARFRPNVIVEGAEPFAEDGWREVKIGEMRFRVTEICDRCAVTLYDPATGAKGQEPLRTLARYRKWDGKTWFGIRLTPLGPHAPGTLTLGAPITTR